MHCWPTWPLYLSLKEKTGDQEWKSSRWDNRAVNNSNKKFRDCIKKYSPLLHYMYIYLKGASIYRPTVDTNCIEILDQRKSIKTTLYFFSSFPSSVSLMSLSFCNLLSFVPFEPFFFLLFFYCFRCISW